MTGKTGRLIIFCMFIIEKAPGYNECRSYNIVELRIKEPAGSQSAIQSLNIKESKYLTFQLRDEILKMDNQDLILLVNDIWQQPSIFSLKREI